MAEGSKERVRRAMFSGFDDEHPLPDRVPTFCQLAVGHYFLHSGVKPFDIWFTSEGFAEALISLQRRYNFDGILVNMPGREPDIEQRIVRIQPGTGEDVIHWKNGGYTRLPHDDNAHYYLADGRRFFPTFEEVDPDSLYYVEPWDVTDITYPYTWGFDSEPRPFESFFPDYHFDGLKLVIERAGEDASVHSEVFSPWSQVLELLNYEVALLAILDDASKLHACLERLTVGAIDLAKRQAACGSDAVLVSSAFAGAGLISKPHYEEFVLPYERKLIHEFKKAYPETPMYTHTCGAIADRLDLMLDTGTQGIDTLDPPPLGTVELDEAKEILEGRAFIKGNIDPVNTLLFGDAKRTRDEATRRIRIGKAGGGYILSSACSVAPAAPPANIAVLSEVAEAEGRYP